MGNYSCECINAHRKSGTLVNVKTTGAKSIYPNVQDIVGGVKELLASGDRQGSLFPDEEDTKRRLLCEAVDKLKDKYGENSLARGRTTGDKG